MRTVDPFLVSIAIGSYADHILGLDLERWLSAEENVALANERGDVALFERQALLPSSVCGHYFFHSRGREALAVAKTFLKEIFTEGYDVELIIGLTPEDNLGALWMNKKLGFQEAGSLDTEAGPHKLFMLTKNDWLQTGGST